MHAQDRALAVDERQPQQLADRLLDVQLVAVGQRPQHLDGDGVGREERHRLQDTGGERRTAPQPVAFTTRHDRPGSLVAVLGAFSERGINLTRVESRPTRRQLGTYFFLLDFEGHRTDAAVAEALAQTERDTLWLRVFGSYPRWQSATDAERHA